MTEKTINVLSIDGGGMRGLYSAVYLSSLSNQYAVNRNIGEIDIGKGFDLITGTSTGGILACALAAKVPLNQVVEMYRQYGQRIFSQKLPETIFGIVYQFFSRPAFIEKGTRNLKEVLNSIFGEMTLGELYQERKIALAIPSIETSKSRGWVFKTPHNGTHKAGNRDSGFRLVDVCLATSAAPIYRHLIQHYALDLVCGIHHFAPAPSTLCNPPPLFHPNREIPWHRPRSDREGNVPVDIPCRHVFR